MSSLNVIFYDKCLKCEKFKQTHRHLVNKVGVCSSVTCFLYIFISTIYGEDISNTASQWIISRPDSRLSYCIRQAHFTEEATEGLGTSSQGKCFLSTLMNKEALAVSGNYKFEQCNQVVLKKCQLRANIIFMLSASLTKV